MTEIITTSLPSTDTVGATAIDSHHIVNAINTVDSTTHSDTTTTPTTAATATLIDATATTTPIDAVSVSTSSAQHAVELSSPPVMPIKKSNMSKKEMKAYRDQVDVVNAYSKRQRIEAGEEIQQRLPKKKVAILLSYCGTGYSGMQM